MRSFTIMSPQLFQCGEFSFWVKPAQQRGDCVYFSRRGPLWDFHAPLGKAASGQEAARHIKVMWIGDLRTCQECNKHLLISSHARTQRLKCSDLRRWIQKCACVVKQRLHFFYALVRLSLATDVSEESHDEVVTLTFFSFNQQKHDLKQCCFELNINEHNYLVKVIWSCKENKWHRPHCSLESSKYINNKKSYPESGEWIRGILCFQMDPVATDTEPVRI